jgi:enterochelin esterase-like enzyme
MSNSGMDAARCEGHSVSLRRWLSCGSLLSAALLLPALGGFAQAAASAAGAAPAQRGAFTPPSAWPATAVNPDHSITFRLNYPSAKQVTVATDALLQPLILTQGSDGVWTGTTPPLPPEHYGYTFVVDGVKILDPLNRETHVNFVDLYSDILVPGTPPEPWELTNIPHGEVTRHMFTTHIGLHYPDDQTAYVVYTPPGYDPKRRGGYPVLYLLHGFSDTEDGWTRSGQANLMMDRMLADGKIVPMIVVMPRGYGDFDVVAPVRPTGVAAATANANNITLFGKTLVDEIIPSVERDYNIAKGRENRAIAGLSMGGQESTTLGLTRPDLFAWVGGMSSAVPRSDFDTHFPGVDAKKANLRLLWIACGTDDRLITANRAFAAWAKEKGLPVTAVETAGAHTFVVWRSNLLAFAPLLFRNQR